ncbi:Capsid scaffolding serine peptidase GPO [Pseudomonas sp. IT-P2]|uniref:GPO family capsid scaffolding protein n=1 Tax=Pseudomonas sp. IT-P2 TaxID=3026456 RepID=UPI0039DFA9E4
MPRHFVTDWKPVATSGKTVDGRHIDPQVLRDMADAYDPDTYTAVIWFEHIRYLGNFGSVSELKAEELDDNKVRLFARLAPNDRLLQLNKEAQKLFPSIEIAPNFADTGKPYLRGLAVTDEPASLGTAQLHFSRRVGDSQCFASDEALGQLIRAEPTDETAMSFFTRLFSQLGSKAPTQDETPPMDQKTAEAFTTAVEKLSTAASSLEKSATTFATQPVEQPKAEATPPTPAAVTLEQFNELKGSLDKLTETFNTALNQGKGQTVPLTTGAVTPEPEPVY